MIRPTVYYRRSLHLRSRLLQSLWFLLLALALVACSSTGGTVPESPAAPTDAPAAGEPDTPTSDAAGQAVATPTIAAPTVVPTPTAVPLQDTPVSTTAPTTAPTAAPTASPPASEPETRSPTYGSEILFLRDETLMAYDIDARRERTIVSEVIEFAATPTGQTLALVRDTSGSPEIWLVARDGSNVRQMTNNDRIEGSLSWAPDGLTLAYASSTVSRQPAPDWDSWTTWCGASEVHLLDIPGGRETALEAGCDPVFSPDGRRIAFATPPTDSNPAGGTPPVGNTIRLVNRQGENGWSFATATGKADGSGQLVYAPSWSPDSSQVSYQRFMGYQALVDINYTEMGNSFEGGGTLLGVGAGWLLPPMFSPDGRSLAVVEHNYSDARGLSGYEVWSAKVLRLGVQEEIFLPDGTRTTDALAVDTLRRATSAAWSPDGRRLAVVLPAGWSADVPADEPRFEGASQGDVWLWEPGSQPGERLVQSVGFASPLVWLSPSPQVEVSDQGYRLVYPASWQLVTSEFEEQTAVAPDGLRLISVAPLPRADVDLASLTVAETFAALVSSDTDEGPPIPWPDGSLYHGFTGTAPDGTPVAGGMRAVERADGTVVVMLYRTTPEIWPLERAMAQNLLAAGGL